MRLDVYLATYGYARSRTHADNLIKLGKVSVNGEVESKSAKDVFENDIIVVDASEDYASLGGLKLAKAMKHYKISAKGLTCIDIGAANGGFTDVMLKGGASKVYCVDIGECALPLEMQSDDRVIIKDKLNARYLSFEDIGIKADLITVDVSFISLTYVLPALLQFMKDKSVIIALIKPQFEVGKAELTKTGIVKSRKAAQKAIAKIVQFAEAIGLYADEVIEAPHPFENKNLEYLVALYKNPL